MLVVLLVQAGLLLLVLLSSAVRHVGHARHTPECGSLLRDGGPRVPAPQLQLRGVPLQRLR